jgi:hypothetical protein
MRCTAGTMGEKYIIEICGIEFQTTNLKSIQEKYIWTVKKSEVIWFLC